MVDKVLGRDPAQQDRRNIGGLLADLVELPAADEGGHGDRAKAEIAGMREEFSRALVEGVVGRQDVAEGVIRRQEPSRSCTSPKTRTLPGPNTSDGSQ